jgi:hypothetical protein
MFRIAVQHDSLTAKEAPFASAHEEKTTAASLASETDFEYTSVWCHGLCYFSADGTF